MPPCPRRPRAALLFVLTAACLALAPSGARAERPPVAPAARTEVQKHAERGREHYERGRYRDAISEYRKAYELEAESRFLFEIAQSYRRLGLTDRALFFYDRYLATTPQAANRAEVEALARELEQRRGGGAATDGPPQGGVGHDVVIVGVPDEDEPAARRPLWKRWWIWALVGAVAAGAGVVLATGREGPAPPATDLGNARFF